MLRLRLGTRAVTFCAIRQVASYGRITDEDRRWWMVHLDCAPDVHPGTFVSWLDSCGTHTTKKLIERNIWTIEQVAGLSSDQVDELRYREGCIHMDVVWEHSRTIISLLNARKTAASTDSDLQERIAALRRKRELERRRDELLRERQNQEQDREARLAELRRTIAEKKAKLRDQQVKASAAAEGVDEDEATSAAEAMNHVEREGGKKE
jgi:hypothetical protein